MDKRDDEPQLTTAESIGRRALIGAVLGGAAIVGARVAAGESGEGKDKDVFDGGRP